MFLRENLIADCYHQYDCDMNNKKKNEHFLWNRNSGGKEEAFDGLISFACNLRKEQFLKVIFSVESHPSE